ncbi:unnamed protein product [Ceutorhynchus assimilis]|uniref:Uncharacterized protein n=1 Tax=Ceutorhynchus assimilis TaxID=467358 RepID=A0A9N9MAV8_9CUCU|nr:unnamed protein product [Ceutorhynchus assimilis]
MRRADKIMQLVKENNRKGDHLDVRPSTSNRGSLHTDDSNDETGLECFDSNDSVADKDYVPDSDTSDDTATKRKWKDAPVNLEIIETITDEIQQKSDEEGDTSNESEEVPPKKKRTRWNKAKPETWKRNVEKKKRSEGQPYLSAQGKQQAPKEPKMVDCSKCRLKCSENFPQETFSHKTTRFFIGKHYRPRNQNSKAQKRKCQAKT